MGRRGWVRRVPVDGPPCSLAHPRPLPHAVTSAEEVDVELWDVRWRNVFKGRVRFPLARVRQRGVVKDTFDLEGAAKARVGGGAGSELAVAGSTHLLMQPPPLPSQGRVSIEFQWLSAFAAA